MERLAFFQEYLVIRSAAAIGSRTHAEALPEAPREIRFVFETHRLGDVDDAHAGVRTKLLSPFHPALRHEIAERPAGFLLEQVREIVRREVCRCRGVGQRDALREILPDVT